MQLHTQRQYGGANAHHRCQVSRTPTRLSNASLFLLYRWRPLNAPGVTKNVIISTNADGGLYHWHTTSNKMLNKIYDPYSQLLTCDYKADGHTFLTAGNQCEIRVYDE
jgi:hypothetical protein